MGDFLGFDESGFDRLSGDEEFWGDPEFWLWLCWRMRPICYKVCVLLLVGLDLMTGQSHSCYFLNAERHSIFFYYMGLNFFEIVTESFTFRSKRWRYCFESQGSVPCELDLLAFFFFSSSSSSSCVCVCERACV